MLNIYDLNLDGEPPENLSELTVQLRAAAKSINDLARYAEARETATRFRRAGQIETAIRIEQFMESLYKQLPPELQW